MSAQKPSAAAAPESAKSNRQRARKAKPEAATRIIRIEQVRSANGRPRGQREVLRSLGLRRIRHVVERPDLPAVRGMVAKIPHLVKVIEG